MQIGNSRRRIKARRLVREKASHEPRRLSSWEKFEITIASMANLTVIFALLIAWWSYRDQQDQARKDASYRVISGMNSGEIFLSQRRLASEIHRLPLSELRGEILPRQTMATIIDQVVRSSDNDIELLQDIITIVNYLDDAAICIETSTCDPVSLNAHLFDSARRYACLLIPYVNTMRDELLLSDLGKSLTMFVDYESNC